MPRVFAAGLGDQNMVIEPSAAASAHDPAEQHETGPTEMSVGSRVTGPIH